MLFISLSVSAHIVQVVIRVVKHFDLLVVNWDNTIIAHGSGWQEVQRCEINVKGRVFNGGNLY